jgi:hypothetical protein
MSNGLLHLDSALVGTVGMKLGDGSHRVDSVPFLLNST